jgi:predicted membrane protein
MYRAGAARALSLTAAGALALSLTLLPQLLGRHAASGTAHAGLGLAMLGMAGGFVHGFGFRPDSVVLRVLFSPWMSWALMAGGLWIATEPVRQVLHA